MGAALLIVVVAISTLGFAAQSTNAQGSTPLTNLATGSGNVLLQANTSSAFVLATTFGPCTGFQIHTHPRGFELIRASTGQLYAGYVDEAGKLITATVTPSNVFLVPQGLVHFVLNRDCKPSDAVFVFPPNPGLQFALAAVGTIPSSTLSFFANGAVPKQKGDLYSSVDQDCLKRCGLNVGGAAAAQGTGAVGASYAKVQQG